MKGLAGLMTESIIDFGCSKYCRQARTEACDMQAISPEGATASRIGDSFEPMECTEIVPAFTMHI